MSYKAEATKAHQSKMKGYADGGGIEAGPPSLLDALSEKLTNKLATQEGDIPEDDGSGELLEDLPPA